MNVCLIIKPGFVHQDIITDVQETFNIKQILRNNSLFVHLKKEQAEAHYQEHRDKPFFKELVDYLTSECVLILKADVDSIEEARALTQDIRNKYTVSKMRNVLHCSDSAEAAEHELNNFFLN